MMSLKRVKTEHKDVAIEASALYPANIQSDMGLANWFSCLSSAHQGYS
jgi:hypothetical protein